MTEFNVMLAHPVGKKEFDKDSFIQPKLDGVRCYISKHGAFSRNHKPFMNVAHILKELKPVSLENCFQITLFLVESPLCSSLLRSIHCDLLTIYEINPSISNSMI